MSCMDEEETLLGWANIGAPSSADTTKKSIPVWPQITEPDDQVNCLLDCLTDDREDLP